tara:strand:- start:586 stop:1494 length:909 start_codon:yes stop_codon:yes gene_type:complete
MGNKFYRDLKKEQKKKNKKKKNKKVNARWRPFKKIKENLDEGKGIFGKEKGFGSGEGKLSQTADKIKTNIQENKANKVGMTLSEWNALSDDERKEKLSIFRDNRKKNIETKLGNLVGDVKSGVKKVFGSNNKTIGQTLGIDWNDPNLPTAVKEYKDKYFVKGQQMNYTEYVTHIKNIKELMGQKSSSKDIQFDIYKKLFESHPDYVALPDAEKTQVIENLYNYIQTKDSQFKSSIHSTIDKEQYDKKMTTDPVAIKKRMQDLVKQINSYKDNYGDIDPNFQAQYDADIQEYKTLYANLQALK